ncbi:MAG: PQQ-binding-like beta-propeller repeat protein [Acidobacteriota bacterium]
MLSPRCLLVLCLVVHLAATPLSADAAPEPIDPEHQWAQWRGPAWTGVATHGNPPVEWAEDTNIRFKVPVPGRGLAAPIVWGDRLILVSAEAASANTDAAALRGAQEKLEKGDWPPAVDPSKQAFVVVAYSTEDGRELWRRVASERVPHESHYLDASWASASPATDGEVLIAHFGSNGTHAYTLDGEPLWSKDLGDMTTRNGFGEGSSPLLWNDWLIILWDHEGDSFLVALDKSTGEERWRVARDEPSSWSTPRVVEVGDVPQVVVAATNASRGYALADGRALWHLGGMTVNTIPTPPIVDGVAYFASGYRGTVLQAVDLAKATALGGDLEGSDAVRWTHDRHTPYVPSMVTTSGHVFFLKHFKNIMSALDATTGEVRWQERLPGITNVYASPVAAAGRLYVVDKAGNAVVVEASATFRVLAENALDDGFDASPAIVGDTLYLRGRASLYAIADEGASHEAPSATPSHEAESADAPRTTGTP